MPLALRTTWIFWWNTLKRRCAFRAALSTSLTIRARGLSSTSASTGSRWASTPLERVECLDRAAVEVASLEQGVQVRRADEQRDRDPVRMKDERRSLGVALVGRCRDGAGDGDQQRDDRHGGLDVGDPVRVGLEHLERQEPGIAPLGGHRLGDLLHAAQRELGGPQWHVVVERVAGDVERP